MNLHLVVALFGATTACTEQPPSEALVFPHIGDLLDAATPMDAQCLAGHSNINGTAEHVYFARAMSHSVPADVGDYQIGAVTFDSDGEATLTEAVPVGRGAFTIACVPDGPYYLRQQSEGLRYYHWRESRLVELVDFRLGRPDSVPSLSANAGIRLRATGLEAWTETHGLDLWAPHSLLRLADPWRGATTFDRVIGMDEVGFLLDDSRGDEIALVQFGPLNPYGYVVRRAVAFSVSTVPDATTNAAMELAVPETRKVELEISYSDFESVVGESAELEGLWLNILTMPVASTVIPAFGNSRGVYGRRINPGDQTTIVAEVAPILSDYKLVAQVIAEVPVGEITSLVDVLRVSVGDAPTTHLQLSPPISAPEGVRVNGSEVLGHLRGVGTSPVVTWESVSSANSYSVEIMVGFEAPVILTTETTSLRVPPGVLTAGHSARLHVFARSGPPRGVNSALAITWAGEISP